MTDAALILLFVAVLALIASQVALGKRLARIRRRARTSILTGPEEHLRLQKQLYDFIARTECIARGVTPRMPLEFRSEWGEDCLLYDLFRGQASGVYIEVGALDGKRCSISWIFDALGWSGLLVEPVPGMHQKCLANRPNAKVVHAALGPAGSTGTTEFMVPIDDEHQPSSYRAHDGMGTEHLKVIEKAGAQLQKITVPLSSMDVELTRAGFGRVDFAVIDVEGGELELFKGFELRRWKPRVLVVEDNSLGTDTRVPEHLAGVGYDPIMWIGANRVYIRRDDPEMQSRCRRAAETVYSPLVRPPGSLANEDRRISAR